MYRLVLLSMLWLGSEGLIVLVDSYSEECFYDLVPGGALLSFKYEVLEGGFHEIDARLTDDHGHVPYLGESRHGDNQLYRINRPGTFGVCFSNEKSSRVPKLVMFDFLHLQEEANLTGAEEFNSTELLVRELGRKLREVKNEMSYVTVRWKAHLRINERSNESVVVWALTQFIVVVALCVWQTYYLLRFFETKRMI